MKNQESILGKSQILNKEHILICYKGPFLDRILALLGEKINILLQDDLRLNKKIFSIFIELAQNVALYSEERHLEKSTEDKTYGKGTFIISEEKDHYTLTSANYIQTSWVPEVLEKCELINSLDTDGLRSLKRELRNKPRYIGQVGGNIGLVDIALKAGTTLDVEINSMGDKFSFFSLSVGVQK